MTETNFLSATDANIASAIPNHRVTIFGEVLADLFPQASVLGGAPFNVARHLCAFGLTPLLISSVGHDALGADILSEMKRLKLDTAAIQTDTKHATGQVNVITNSTGMHQFEILPEQAYDYIYPDSAIHNLSTRLFYFGTLAQRNSVSRRTLYQALSTTRATKLFDINLRAPWYDRELIEQSLNYADIVKMNDEELSVLAEIFSLSGNSAYQHGQTLLDQFDLDSVIVTCGQLGAWLIERGGNLIHAESYVIEDPIVDTVGAGDGFVAVYILGMLLDWPIKVVISRANQFAASVCTIRGAAPACKSFYAPFIQAWLNQDHT